MNKLSKVKISSNSLSDEIVIYHDLLQQSRFLDECRIDEENQGEGDDQRMELLSWSEVWVEKARHTMDDLESDDCSCTGRSHRQNLQDHCCIRLH